MDPLSAQGAVIILSKCVIVGVYRPPVLPTEFISRLEEFAAIVDEAEWFMPSN